MFKEGDYVSRNSYNNDIVFVIIKIENDNYILKGVTRVLQLISFKMWILVL